MSTMPPIKNTPSDILLAWAVLEVLSPQTFKKREELASGPNQKVLPLNHDSCPWELQQKEKPSDASVKQQIFYQVVLGTINVNKAMDGLLSKYGEARIERSSASREAVLAIAVLDENGCLIKDGTPIVVSSFGWGLPQALKGDLSQLAHWHSAEQRMIQELECILRQADQPLNKNMMEAAYAQLIKTFDIPVDMTINSCFAIQSFEKAGAPQPSMLNSFYLSDLNIARRLIAQGNAPENLLRYLGKIAPSQRHNVLEDHALLEEIVAANLMPPARWPGKGGHPLVLFQQAAVNLAFRDLQNGGILAVNGPPGTGKTTLLRDVVSGLVTKRAETMCLFDDPETAFTMSDQKITTIGAWSLSLHHLDPRLKGFEMLIASSNNSAVENITAELPNKQAIAEDVADLRYFSVLSDKLSKCQSWGLIAAVLGNARNRYLFRETFWWDKEVGLINYFTAITGNPKFIERRDPQTDQVIERRPPHIVAQNDPPRNHQEAVQHWHEARQRFQKALHASRSALTLCEDIRIHAREMPQLETAERDTREALNQACAKQNCVQDDLDRSQISLQSTETEQQKITERMIQHQSWKPGFFARLFRTRTARTWRSLNDELSIHCLHMQTEIRIQNEQIKELKKQLVTCQGNVAVVKAKYDTIYFAYDYLKQKIESVGSHFVNTDTFSAKPPEEWQQISPWCDKVAQTLRDRVFVEAMKLHKAFIDAAAKPLQHNLGALMKNLTGLTMTAPEQIKFLPDLWSSLFLVVPSVSTAFASVDRMLEGMPPESIGWLLIDEAGQALPQAAVGAIMRTKRSVVVGDPAQIAPVVTLPEKLTSSVCRLFSVEPERFNAPQASVQTLADKATAYFAEFHSQYGRRTVGVPLLVHRRCADPMFKISNAVAYGRLMIHAKQSGASLIRDCLGPSAWIDVQGGALDNKWCPEEGRKVLELLRILKGKSIPPDLYIVTPFLVVAESMRKMIRDSQILRSWVEDDWLKKRVGTAHTAQGREAEAVIFVLGASGSEHGKAREWAGKQPNLLNVAVTRAKEALYVVGNKSAWNNQGVFNALCEALNEEPDASCPLDKSA